MAICYLCPSMWADPDCGLCPRLVSYREQNRRENPDWHNAPAMPFGDLDARLLIVGLAPGRTGANRTGRVFTGDSAGRTLFEALLSTGFAIGHYQEMGDDDLCLMDCVISNAVLCAPPENKPTTEEQATCLPYLTRLIKAMPKLQVIVTLGDVARRNLLKALGVSASITSGGHGATVKIGNLLLINSYHCSRYNLNTGRLTPQTFALIFQTVREHLQ